MRMQKIIDLAESEAEKPSKEAWKDFGFKTPEAYNTWRYLTSPAMEGVVDRAIRNDRFKTGGQNQFGNWTRGNYDYTPAERIMMHFGAAEGEGPKSGEKSIRKTDQKLPDGTPVRWTAVKEAMDRIVAESKSRARFERERAKSIRKWGY